MSSPNFDMQWALQAAQCYKDVYSLLAHIFYTEPNEALLKKLADRETRSILDTFGGDVREPFGDTDVSGFVENLAEEYCTLFIAPPGHISLCESVARGSKTLWGEVSEDVACFYRNCGFAPSDSSRQPPDHLSLELQFMAHLAAEEADMWQAQASQEALDLVALEKQFLEGHLSLWLGPFAERVAERARFPFYPSFAHLAAKTVASHLAHLNALTQMNTTRNLGES